METVRVTSTPVATTPAAHHSASADAGGVSGVLRRYGETAVIKASSAKGRTTIVTRRSSRDVGGRSGVTFRQPAEVGVRGNGSSDNSVPVVVATTTSNNHPTTATEPSRLPRPMYRDTYIPSMLVPASVFDPDPPRAELSASVPIEHGLVSIFKICVHLFFHFSPTSSGMALFRDMPQRPSTHHHMSSICVLRCALWCATHSV